MPCIIGGGRICCEGFSLEDGGGQASVRFHNSFLRTERIQGSFLRSNSNGVKV